MKRKTECCAGCGANRPVWKRDQRVPFCQGCWQRKSAEQRGTLNDQRQRQAINKRSVAQIARDKTYSEERKAFMALPGNDCCKAGFAGCTGRRAHLLTIHHKKGRGQYLLDTSTWVVLCLSCHEKVHNNPAAAEDLGYITPRLELPFPPSLPLAA